MLAAGEDLDAEIEKLRAELAEAEKVFVDVKAKDDELTALKIKVEE